MAAGSDTSPLTARFLLPDLIERGRVNVLSCPLWQSGALVAPTALGSSLTVWDGSGVKQLDAVAVTVSGSTASYSYTPAASLDYSEGWRFEWTLEVATVSGVYRNDGALVRNVLYPVVADPDLYRRHRGLDPAGTSPVSTVANYQDYRDDAWATIQLRLINMGNRLNLILSPSALRECHLTLTLALIFEDFATSLNETYAERATDYRHQYKAAWDALRYTYAPRDDDDASAAQHRRAASPTVWLMSRR